MTTAPSSLRLAPQLPRAHHASAPLLTLDQVVSVAEQSMERAGLTGPTWVLPSPTAFPEGSWDPRYRRATAGPAALVRSALTAHDVDPDHFRVLTGDDLEATGCRRSTTDGYSQIVVSSGPVTALTLMHQCAHVLNRAAGGGGHDTQFVLIASELYRTYLSPAAAEQFQLVTSLHPSAQDLRTELAG